MGSSNQMKALYQILTRINGHG